MIRENPRRSVAKVLHSSVKPPEIVGTIQRHDQDARPEGDDVRGLAQIEAADTTDEQIADGKIKEAPYDIDRRGRQAHPGGDAKGLWKA